METPKRNCANQEDSTLTDSELTVSAKALDQYTSQENLAALFHDKEQAASLAKLSAELLTAYPNYSYHQSAHGVDVMLFNTCTDGCDSSGQHEIRPEGSVAGSSSGTRCWI